MCNNIDKFINQIYEFEYIEEYLEMANYVIIYLDDDIEKINEQIMEYLTADSLQEMCRWGITPHTKALLFDVRFGFEKELFNSDEISSNIYEILYDYIEEGLEKYYYYELPFDENTLSRRRKLVKEAIKLMDYENFDKLVSQKIF